MKARLSSLISRANTERCGSRHYPVLSMTMHDGLVLQSDRFKKEIASKNKSQYKVVRRGQLVVGFPIDEGVLATQEVTDRGIVSPAYDIWDIEQSLVLPKYLELSLRSEKAIEYYRAKLKGTTARRRSIRKDDFLSMSINVPGIDQQRFALDRMKAVDELLSGCRFQLDKLDDLVKSRFIEMFGDPLYSADTRPLSEVGYIGTGSTPSTKEAAYYSPEGLPFIKPGDLPEDSISLIYDSETHLSVKGGDVARVFPVGTVLVTCIGTLGKVGISSRKGACNQQINYVIPYDDVDCVYLAYCLLMCKTKLFEMANAPVVPIVNKTQFSSLKIPVPNLALQREFSVFVAQIDKLRFDVQQQIEKLETLKKSLMQEYFG